MRIIKAVAVLFTILEVSAICWTEATLRIEPRPFVLDLSFPTSEDYVPATQRKTGCVVYDWDAVEAEASDPSSLPN